MVFSIAFVMIVIVYVCEYIGVFDDWTDDACSIVAGVHILSLAGLTFSVVTMALQYMP
jgi:hypothetical protein